MVGFIGGARHHHGDDLSHMANPAHGDWEMLRDRVMENVFRRKPGLGDIQMIGADDVVEERAEPVGGKIIAAQHQQYPRRRPSLGHVQAGDIRMGVDAADETGIDLAIPVDIVGEFAAAGQQAPVFHAPERLADQFLHFWNLPG